MKIYKMHSKVLLILIATFFLASCSEDLEFKMKNAIEKIEFLEEEFAELDTTKKDTYKDYIIQTKEGINGLEQRVAALKKQLGEEKKLEPVEISILGKTDFKKYVSIQSIVESDKNSLVSPKLQGVITAINVDEGQYVKQGTILMEIDNSLQLRRLAQAKNQLSFIETVYEKQKRVWDKKVGSEIDFLKAKNDYENMLENIKLIEEEITMLRIAAPFSGIVDEIMPKVGEAVAPGMGVIRLVSNSDLQIKVNFAENYLSNFEKGDEVKVYFPDLELDTINLRINSISRAIDAKKRTVTAVMNVPAKYNQIKPNMTCITKLEVYSKDSTLVIPLNLIQRQNDEEFVYIAENNNEGNPVATKKVIKTGVAYNEFIVVKSGLEIGDRLITSGENTVRNGKEINIINN